MKPEIRHDAEVAVDSLQQRAEFAVTFRGVCNDITHCPLATVPNTTFGVTVAGEVAQALPAVVELMMLIV